MFWKAGQKYLIRTVTMCWTGRVSHVTESEIVLEDAAWVADTGRYSDAVANGFSSEAEIEPVEGLVAVGRGAIVDAVEWRHELPRVAQ